MIRDVVGVARGLLVAFVAGLLVWLAPAEAVAAPALVAPNAACK